MEAGETTIELIEIPDCNIQYPGPRRPRLQVYLEISYRVRHVQRVYRPLNNGRVVASTRVMSDHPLAPPQAFWSDIYVFENPALAYYCLSQRFDNLGIHPNNHVLLVNEFLQRLRGIDAEAALEQQGVLHLRLKVRGLIYHDIHREEETVIFDEIGLIERTMRDIHREGTLVFDEIGVLERIMRDIHSERTVLFDEIRVVDRAMRESRLEFERSNYGMRPTAPKALIMKCVKVKDEICQKGGGADENWTCTICLEELEEYAAAMPCKHMFHGNCIVKWLEFSHYCPVCRFEMPTET